MKQHGGTQRVAVLGAGVMGAQIAAHFANMHFEVCLFDLDAPAPADARDHVRKSLTVLTKLEPAPLAHVSKLQHIKPCTYEKDLALLSDCFLIVEAVSERLDIKESIYKKITPYLNKAALFATNTSGLSIKVLSEFIPEDLKPRFCGVHFFNPPRYLQLVELIPGPQTQPAVLDFLEEFFTSVMGKNIIRAQDTPNFVANRVGVFSLLAAVYHAERLKLGLDIVDLLTGPAIGRAKSATLRTLDVVGLDTFSHVVKTMQDGLSSDPWHRYYVLPQWIQDLVAKGRLGQKSGQGVYLKKGKEILVYDIDQKDYRPSAKDIFPAVASLLKQKDTFGIFDLRQNDHPQAQFLWCIFRDIFHYAAAHAHSIAQTVLDVDGAMRWGFGWQKGPFEQWQMMGWEPIARAIEEDRTKGKTLVAEALPQWVYETPSVYLGSNSAYSPKDKIYKNPFTLKVYQRQYAPEIFGGGPVPLIGHTLFENQSLRLWSIHEGIGIISFKTKMHAVDYGVLEGILKAVEYGETHLQGLIVWNSAPFSAGAHLAQVLELLKKKDFTQIESFCALFQDASMVLKHASVPTVSAVQGLALGGGCEIAIHCQRVVAALETYIGLVEVGVGVLPAGGGCKEAALRCFRNAQSPDFSPAIQKYFMQIAMGQVSRSAWDAKELGYLRPSDIIIPQVQELLYAAHMQVQAMASVHQRPEPPLKQVTVAGSGAYATLRAQLLNMREGGFISDHDVEVGQRIAYILTGGEFPGGTVVEEDWFLRAERRLFTELIRTDKTLQRIEHMLVTGKPLRN